MRLLKREASGWFVTTSIFSLTEYDAQNTPAYAILSHRWGSDEVTFKDIEQGTAKRKVAGYKKLEFCAAQADRDGLRYFWVDTCCIDKTSSAELSEAINSMFKWYHNASRCYVFLPDVHARPGWEEVFLCSEWFNRGWTLQELIAPQIVEFFSVEGVKLGNKGTLEQLIRQASGVSVEALRGKPLSHIPEEERFSWAAQRKTTVAEDAVYCLLGIFDVHMPLIYGEGQQKALVRLQREVHLAANTDLTVSPNARRVVHDTSGEAADSDESTSSQRHGTVGSSVPALHPVKGNYRQVHVTILYWTVDDIQDKVQKIREVFHSLYHYQVYLVSLPYSEDEGLHDAWPYPTFVDDKDLQIMYYIGGTATRPGLNTQPLYFEASPFVQQSTEEAGPDERRGARRTATDWLCPMITIPNLESDVFIVLDCFVAGLAELSPAQSVQYLSDDDDSWARYLVLFAGYTNSTVRPGTFSNKLMSVLERLAASRKFLAREGLIKTHNVVKKLGKETRFNDEMNIQCYGNDGRNDIHMSPLRDRFEEKES